MSMSCRAALAELVRLHDNTSSPLSDESLKAWEAARAALSAPDGGVAVPKEPTYDEALNAAGWAMVEALPSCPGEVFNNIKPALLAAIRRWVELSAPPLDTEKEAIPIPRFLRKNPD